MLSRLLFLTQISEFYTCLLSELGSLCLVKSTLLSLSRDFNRAYLIAVLLLKYCECDYTLFAPQSKICSAVGMVKNCIYKAIKQGEYNNKLNAFLIFMSQTFHYLFQIVQADSPAKS